MNVLALDFSNVQIKGSERRTNNITKAQQKRRLRESERPQPVVEGCLPHKQEGTLLHKTVLINPVSLQESITAWLSNDSVPGPIPIICIALHACGSLTPDLLHFFVKNARISPDRSWFAAGLIVAGCCYNLMSPETGLCLQIGADCIYCSSFSPQISPCLNWLSMQTINWRPNCIYPTITAVWLLNLLYSGPTTRLQKRLPI